MSGIGTVIAAIAAVVAARYAKGAVAEAARSAKAAADQVDLARPRPIVLVTFSYSGKDQTQKVDRTREFRLENIGNSPAFDVHVSPIGVPDASHRLITEGLSYLKASENKSCVHGRDPAGGVLSVLQPAETFAHELICFFDKTGSGSLSENAFRENKITFTLSYRALDGRRFAQRYAFIVVLMKEAAWIEPIGSLLENTADGAK